MSIIYTIVGLLVVAAISISVIAWSFHSIIEDMKERKRNAYSEWAHGVCASINRWCDYEFPQVGYTVREISKSISHGWSFDPDHFRECLRNKAWEKPNDGE